MLDIQGALRQPGWKNRRLSIMILRILQAFVTWCLILCCFIHADPMDKPKVTCSKAKTKCSNRVGCNAALMNFYIACGNMMNKKDDTCTLVCQRSLVSLLSTDDNIGHEFMSCDCEGNEYCEERAKRVFICYPEVMKYLERVNSNKSIISCTLALWLCEADTSCYTALNYYRQNCEELFNGHKCTQSCNNSVKILYNRPKAKKLFTCQCEGTEAGYDCQAVKDYTMQLCFWNHSNLGYKTNGNPTPSASNCLTYSKGILFFLLMTFYLLNTGCSWCSFVAMLSTPTCSLDSFKQWNIIKCISIWKGTLYI
jgi:growth arrest-specific protein 1